MQTGRPEIAARRGVPDDQIFEIIHPQLLAALAWCGHKSQILIADSNFACRVNANADATLIQLNLAPHGTGNLYRRKTAYLR